MGLNSHRRIFGRRYSTPFIILMIGIGLAVFGVFGHSKVDESMSSKVFYSVVTLWGIMIICGVIIWICRRKVRRKSERFANTKDTVRQFDNVHLIFLW